MQFIATIINALAVQRQAEGASHSANTLTPGINSCKQGTFCCDYPKNVGYKQPRRKKGG